MIKNSYGLRGLYVVYDRLAEQSGPLFEAPNDAVAVRMMQNMMRPKSGLEIRDFELWCVGARGAEGLVSGRSKDEVTVLEWVEPLVVSEGAGQVLAFGSKAVTNVG